ncbi:MAG TPA: vWA domain-containing protein [Steroidobacteraceae bacterium]|nr:vWA domain-containing protein [Steroidobacteraceae bacterium]
MITTLDFAHPWALLLLPLAVLPLLRRRRDTLPFSYAPWLPKDPLGQIAGWLWRILATVAIFSTVIALAGLGKPQTQVARVGRGAEILVLMDRSRSMDDHMLPSDWRKYDRSLLLHHLARGQPKAKVARDLLTKFVAERPDDRFALMFFSTKPLSVVSFTQHDEVVQAGIAAADIGRGLSNTEVGRALLAAIAEFDRRAYSGSRIILLVSDGGAYLDEPTRQRVLAGLARNRVALYWIYLRSYNAPTLDHSEPDRENAPEMALHNFFQTLRTPYRAYQAEVPEDLEKAVADVGRQQNFPLDFLEAVPRQDYSRRFVAAAAICCLLLLLGRSLALRSWA